MTNLTIDMTKKCEAGKDSWVGFGCEYFFSEKFLSPPLAIVMAARLGIQP